MEFRPDVGQLLINPVPEKKSAVYHCSVWLWQSRSFHQRLHGLHFYQMTESDFDEFSERGEAELDTSVPSGSWIRGRLCKFLHV